ncbi:MAG: peptidylprolyl isomerase [Acidobacteriota bacterium]
MDQYGTGGLYELKREPNDLSHIRGTLAQQKLIQRVEILKTSLRERPPPEEPPFINASEDELSRYRVLIKTELGEIEIAFNERDATEHVRQFLTFAQLGLYDGTPFHRVVPGFVIQGGSISMREEPPAAKYVHLIKNLVPEFSAKRKHLRGAVSMARGPELNSAVDSFFIVLEDQPRLDGQYTVFGRVVQGMDVVDMIALQPLAGERLVKPLKMKLEVVKVKE